MKKTGEQRETNGTTTMGQAFGHHGRWLEQGGSRKTGGRVRGKELETGYFTTARQAEIRKQDTARHTCAVRLQKYQRRDRNKACGLVSTYEEEKYQPRRMDVIT
jgi:hypothetical protein